MRPQTTTVVIPVYRGVDDVRACIDSVLRHGASTPVHLVVIDDHSPEPAVRSYLDALDVRSDDIELELLRNDANLGFVRTVNRGLLRARGDVVILNADTVVTEGWLDHLRWIAETEPDVGTVTPLTNFGSLCTLPPAITDAFDLNTPSPRVDDCAAFVRANGLERHPEVVAGVGFCLYVRKEALDDCGPLDEESFGRGYGEEVDFCIRAARLGYRHLVDDANFVYHRGGVSFGDEREEGLARGSALLRHRYPFFRPYNTRERKRDPLAPSFAALVDALEQRDEGRPHVLHILHSDPAAMGGTEKHLAALLEALLPTHDFSILHPVTSGFVLRTLWHKVDGGTIEKQYLLPGAARWAVGVSDSNAGFALRTALDMFEFDAVHIQNLINHSLAPLEVLADFSGRVICSVRDLFLACPNHSLLYLGEDCGLPSDLSYCATCLPETTGLPPERLQAARTEVREHLDVIDTWVFASTSAVDYFSRVYDVPDDRIDLVPHGALVDVSMRRRSLDEELIEQEPLRLAFVGLGRTKKGLDTACWLADQLADSGSDIEVHHFGRLVELASSNLHLHDSYDNDLLPTLLDNAGIHVVLLPGRYAETFGHVMTEALLAGRPVIGASYGALGERIRASHAGWTFDPMDRGALLELVSHIDSCRDELRRATIAAMRTSIRPVAATAGRYAQLYKIDPDGGAIE